MNMNTSTLHKHTIRTLLLVLVAVVALPRARGDTLRGTARKLTSCLPVAIGASQRSHSVCADDPPTSKECEMAGGASYHGDGGDQAVVFEYGELVERATQYKRAIVGTAADHPVYLHFAMYKLALNVWTCVDPSRGTYGTTSGWGGGCTGDGDSKLIYKFVAAARAGVEVRIVFHNPDGIPARGDPSATEHKIWDYLTEKVSSLPPTFQIHRADWKDGTSHGQMHNKFLLVSHHKTPNGMLQVTPQTSDTPFSVTQISRYTHSVYVTTQNVNMYGNDSGSENTDLHLGDYVETGVLVRGNEGLYDHYVQYFEAIWDHTLPAGDVDGEEDAAAAAPCTVATCARGFRERMRELHEDPAGPLNYDGRDVQAFFYPLPDRDRLWDAEHNAVARYVDRLAGDATDGTRYLKLNVYHLKGGAFLRALLEALSEAPLDKLHVRVVYTRDNSHSVLEEVRDLPLLGGNLAFRSHSGEQVTHPYRSGEIRNWSPESNKKTHAKNYNLYYKRNGRAEWVTITGSANGKDNAYNSKANNQLVLVEREKVDGGNPPVYEAHKVAFYKAY